MGEAKEPADKSSALYILYRGTLNRTALHVATALTGARANALIFTQLLLSLLFLLRWAVHSWV
jgi:hypothetical protein